MIMGIMPIKKLAKEIPTIGADILINQLGTIGVILKNKM